MIKRKTVIVAMSGGVDSSVAAALLKNQGYNVIGLTMTLTLPLRRPDKQGSKNLILGEQEVKDARRVAFHLNIKHDSLDCGEVFGRTILENFFNEYRQGKTPNPCVRCNRDIKFGVLMEYMKYKKAVFFSTGHYARIDFNPENKEYLLKEGLDKEKDQSYFLYTLTQEQLSNILFPLGNLTKKKVQKKAKELILPATSRESQEICFIPKNDYVGFFRKQIPEDFLPGPVIDTENNILGHHGGILNFTIGQRRGLGIAAPRPLYVLEIRRDSNTVVVGPDEMLLKNIAQVSCLNVITGHILDKPFQADVKIRYKHKAAPAWIYPLGSQKVRLEFKSLQRAITPGQSAVFYEGNTVIGGGIIESAERK